MSLRDPLGNPAGNRVLDSWKDCRRFNAGRIADWPCNPQAEPDESGGAWGMSDTALRAGPGATRPWRNLHSGAVLQVFVPWEAQMSASFSYPAKMIPCGAEWGARA